MNHFASFNRNALYLNDITEMGCLLSNMLEHRDGTTNSATFDQIINASLEFCPQPLLLTDPHGVIIQYNHLARVFLKTCSISAISLWQMLPSSIARQITEGHQLFEKNTVLGGTAIKLSTRPVMVDGVLTAIYIRFDGELAAPADESGFFGNIIGTSPAAETIHHLIKRVANSPSPVLITGETGTGKELAARAIHEQSKRNKYPFVAINCSSIPENLFESELFGYEEGSFTGAKKGGKIGKIEMAQGGTLFLDEIGEIPLSVQPKLLRVLQEYELERVGSNKKIHLDIRIVAATNRNLADMVAEKTFREDLYYRINVINLKLPPLRERSGDILPIAEDYLKRLHRRMETPLAHFSDEVLSYFSAYGWPGNVRELQNVIEYAANLCESDTMTLKDLPESLLSKSEPQKKAAPVPLAPTDSGEAERLRALLEKYGYTLEGKKRIAAELNISLRTQYRKLARLEGE